MTGPVKNCQPLYCVGIGLFICARPLADGNQNLLSTQKRGGGGEPKPGECAEAAGLKSWQDVIVFPDLFLYPHQLDAN